MVGRVLLGSRSGAYGLWISRPGKSVMSGNPDDFLLSPDAETAQIVKSGVFSGSSWFNTGRTFSGVTVWGMEVTHGLGYVPVHFFNGPDAKLDASGAPTLAPGCDATRIGIYTFGASPPAIANPVYYEIYKARLLLGASTLSQGACAFLSRAMML